MCNKDLDALRNWTLIPTPETAVTLGRQGVEDMNFLAGRTKINFPDLFPPVVNQVDAKNYEVRFDQRIRSTEINPQSYVPVVVSIR